MDVVGDAQGVGDGQQKRVGLLNGLVLRELLNELVRLGGIAAAKDGTAALLDKSDFVAPGSFLPKVEAVLFGDQGKNGPAYRDARLTRVPGFLPRLPV